MTEDAEYVATATAIVNAIAARGILRFFPRCPDCRAGDLVPVSIGSEHAFNHISIYWGCTNLACKRRTCG